MLEEWIIKRREGKRQDSVKKLCADLRIVFLGFFDLRRDLVVDILFVLFVLLFLVCMKLVIVGLVGEKW